MRRYKGLKIPLFSFVLPLFLLIIDLWYMLRFFSHSYSYQEISTASIVPWIIFSFQTCMSLKRMSYLQVQLIGVELFLSLMISPVKVRVWLTAKMIYFRFVFLKLRLHSPPPAQQRVYLFQLHNWSVWKWTNKNWQPSSGMPILV